MLIHTPRKDHVIIMAWQTCFFETGICFDVSGTKADTSEVRSLLNQGRVALFLKKSQPKISALQTISAFFVVPFPFLLFDILFRAFIQLLNYFLIQNFFWIKAMIVLKNFSRIFCGNFSRSQSPSRRKQLHPRS